MDCAIPLSAPRELRPSSRDPQPRRAAVAVSTVVHLGLLTALALLILQRQLPQPQPGVAFAVVAAPAEPTFQRLPPAVLQAAAPIQPDLAPVPPIAAAARALRHAGAPARYPGQRNAALPSTQPAAAPAPAPTLQPPDPAPGALAALAARIRQAVQNAAIYPATARMMHREGRAELRFDYADGAVSAVSLAQSSRSPQLDAAALDAIHRAAIPPAPPAIGARKLTLLVWVDFHLSADD
jgi:protein TonB